MKILAVPDSFKGSLTSMKICEIIEHVLNQLDSSSQVVKIPMADGGEGTVDALVLNTGGTFVECRVHGPLMEPVMARYGILGDKYTAVIEMASASGLTLIRESQRNPMITTSFGTGELVLDAVGRGCKKIIMGIGGSATNDGGAGMLKALGFAFEDGEGNAIAEGAAGLLDLGNICSERVNPSLAEVEFLIACDVDNPLLGINGASYIYGPQKGATAMMRPLLDQALSNFSRVIEATTGRQVADVPGAGAAGGMGAGLLAFLNTTLKSGFEIISDAIGLDKIMEEGGFDFIVTGEGEINSQTLNGKLPIGVAHLAQKHNIPVIAVVGSVGEGIDAIDQHGITGVFSIVNRPMSLDLAIQNAEALYEKTIRNVFRLLLRVSK